MSAANCVRTYKKRSHRKCYGKTDGTTYVRESGALAACEARDDCAGVERDPNGTYRVLVHDAKKPFGVRKDPQPDDWQCWVRGRWTDDVKEAADDGVLEGLPRMTRLGYLDGWTRKDRRTLLLPYSIPRQVVAGGAKRDIYMILDDHVDVFKNGGWERETRQRMYRVMAKSDAYDRHEDRACGASRAGPRRRRPRSRPARTGAPPTGSALATSGGGPARPWARAWRSPRS